jgi:hypothetical protein
VTEKAGLSAPPYSAWYFRVGVYSQERRSVAYGEPLQADNGFETYIRGSSYKTDGNIPAQTGDAGGDAGGTPGPGAGGADIKLDAAGLRELGRLRIVGTAGGKITGGGEPVTRGEFAAMLVRALKTDEKAIGSFDDVKQGHPYYTEIMQGARLGFIKPETGSMFFPDRIITRAEMAVFVYDSLLSRGTPPQPRGPDVLRPFPDSGEIPARLMAAVTSVFGERIMIGIGMEDGSRIIGIWRESTREQAALVIYRYIRHIYGIIR